MAKKISAVKKIFSFLIIKRLLIMTAIFVIWNVAMIWVFSLIMPGDKKLSGDFANGFANISIFLLFGLLYRVNPKYWFFLFLTGIIGVVAVIMLMVDKRGSFAVLAIIFALCIGWLVYCKVTRKK